MKSLKFMEISPRSATPLFALPAVVTITDILFEKTGTLAKSEMSVKLRAVESEMMDGTYGGSITKTASRSEISATFKIAFNKFCSDEYGGRSSKKLYNFSRQRVV